MQKREKYHGAFFGSQQLYISLKEPTQDVST